MISDNPNVRLGIVSCSLYALRIALKDGYHTERIDMLAYTPVEYNYLEISAKTFIIPARRNQFSQENNLTMLQFVELPLQRVKNLSSLDPILKIDSGISNWISGKLENSEQVSQSWTWMPLIIVVFMLQQ